MVQYIKKFFKFKWLSTNFFIRVFLLLIVATLIFTLIIMVKENRFDTPYALGQMGFIAVLLTLNQVKKK